MCHWLGRVDVVVRKKAKEILLMVIENFYDYSVFTLYSLVNDVSISNHIVKRCIISIPVMTVKTLTNHTHTHTVPAVSAKKVAQWAYNMSVTWKILSLVV